MRSAKANSFSTIDGLAEAVHLDRHMQVVGDPAALPDAFFDALASLLLSLDQRQENATDARPEGTKAR